MDYQGVMAAAAEAGVEGLGARQKAVVLGWDSASASRVEGARARLKAGGTGLAGGGEAGKVQDAAVGTG